MSKVTWRLADGTEIVADVRDGMSVMQAALTNNVPHILGECGGGMSCATCHVFVHQDWIEKVGAPDDMEDDMLEMTDVERQPNSRLSCQIEVSPELDGLVLVVPEPD